MSYNGQLYHDFDGTPIYPQANGYPRHGVQVQIPRMQQNIIHPSETSNANRNHQAYVNQHGLQQDTRLPIFSQQINASLQPSPEFQTATNGLSQPIPREIPPEVSVPLVDNQMIMLALAEEYFTAAFGQSFGLESHIRENDIRLYYKLIATGLGCLDSVLRVFWSSYPMRTDTK